MANHPDAVAVALKPAVEEVRPRHRRSPPGGRRRIRAAVACAAVLLGGGALPAISHLTAPGAPTGESAPTPRREIPRDLAAGQAREVVTDLVRRRAAVLQRQDAPQPGGAGTLVGSSADRADRAAVQAMLAAGWRYQGLRIDVRAVAPQRLRGRLARVEVVLDVSGYSVIDRDGGVLRRVPAQRGVRRALGLAWTGTGWQVATVRDR